MILHRVLSLAIWAAALAPAAAVTAREHVTAINRATMSSHIEYLASDELGGRGVGSRGIDLAADYIAAHFAQCGLRPGGEEGSYFQMFDIPIRSQDPQRCRLTVVGADSNARAQEDFVALPSSGSGAFEGPLVFAGYGIRDTEKGYDDYGGVDVTGAVVLVLRYEPDRGKDRNDGRPTRHATFIAKGRLAKERGAVAVLVVNPPGEAGDDLNAPRRLGGEDAGLPMLQVTRKLADRLLAAAGQDSLELLHARISRESKPISMALAGIKISGDPGVQMTVARTKNVIGILPGSGPLAQEHVVLGGHYDHLGIVPPSLWGLPSQDTSAAAQIHNGADDNASGTAAVMELARVYSTDSQPRRTLVFMAFSGEEIGLLGSEHFIEHPTIPLQDIVAMINLDMVGRLGRRAVVVYGSDSAREFASILDKHAQALGLEIQKSGMTQNSDHASFYRKKIPVLFPFAGLHEDYHQPTDDFDKLDHDGAAQITQFVLAVVDELIVIPTRPTYQKAAAVPVNDLKVRMGIVPSSAPSDGKPGWLVAGVTEGGPAAQAGMREGDRMLTVNDQPIANFNDYMKIMAPFQPGDEVDVRVTRSDSELKLKVKLIGR